MYREIIRIKQRWQRCVVAGLEDADRRIDIRGQGSTPRRPKRASYAVSGRGSTLGSSHEKSEYSIIQNFGVHSRLHRMGDTPSSCFDADGLCR